MLISPQKRWCDHLERAAHTLLETFLPGKVDHNSEAPCGFIAVWQEISLQALRNACEKVHHRRRAHVDADAVTSGRDVLAIQPYTTIDVVIVVTTCNSCEKFL